MTSPTPQPAFGFAGLQPNDQWCLCADRWVEAFEAGAAPDVVLESTHARAGSSGSRWTTSCCRRSDAVTSSSGSRHRSGTAPMARAGVRGHRARRGNILLDRHWLLDAHRLRPVRGPGPAARVDPALSSHAPTRPWRRPRWPHGEAAIQEWCVAEGVPGAASDRCLRSGRARRPSDPGDATRATCDAVRRGEASSVASAEVGRPSRRAAATAARVAHRRMAGARRRRASWNDVSDRFGDGWPRTRTPTCA